MFRSLFKALLGPPPTRKPYADDVLGPLNPGDNCWEAEVMHMGRMVHFQVGGIAEPDTALLDHAHTIHKDFEQFQAVIHQYLDLATSDYPSDVREEVMRQEIDLIMLPWPSRPQDGMIFFRGQESDIGGWRCDYINGMPTGLGCDT